MKNTEKNCRLTPLISVVIPMYNVSKTIEQCLNSVIDQTFDQFELICVDDGCTDNTVELLQRFDDPRIRLLRQSNKGLAAARNSGINASHAPFIALLDSDDYWHPEKLAMHFRHLCNNPVLGVSYSSSRFVDDNGSDIGLGQYPKITNVTPAHILCRNPVGNGSAPVIRRLALEQIAFRQIINGEERKAFFDETLRQSEDIELWVRLALNTHWLFEGIDQALTFYRVNASGLSANLARQLAAWEKAMARHNSEHPEFFAQWYTLARAYQKRYLARRAIQSNNASAALTLFIEAIATDIRMVIQEPMRTAVTGACAILSLLPAQLYLAVQQIAIRILPPKKAQARL